MTRATFFAVALFALVVAPGGPGAHANGVILSGTVTSATGEKMGGVTVSAKAEGSTITTSVFTDESGVYVFPPLPAGPYRVWAQALSFETAKGAIALGAARRQDFSLKPAQDYFQQLPGDVMLAALPGDTPDDFRMKTQVRKNCTGCHTASFPLQYKFDEPGWNAILELMKRLNVFGHYLGAEHKGTPNIDFHQKELAAYLARARGPGASSMKVALPQRPKGETARVVFKEYDFPLGETTEKGLYVSYAQEAKERLALLKTRGPGPEAFTFRSAHPPPGEPTIKLPEVDRALCVSTL